MMNELADAVARCSGCGMCQAVCPVYGVTGREADVTRGKLELLKGLMGDLFSNPGGAYDRLDRCLLCGSCAKNCPRGVDAVALFLQARSIIRAYQGLPVGQKVLFQRLMADPSRFNRFVAWGSKWQHLILKPSAPYPDASCARLVSPLLSNRRIMPLAPIAYHQMKKPIAVSDGKAIRVAFFVGCLLDKVFPRVAEKIADVLTARGARVIIPDAQGCCGIPALAAGDMNAFHRMARYHIDLFSPDTCDYLVTGCATCTATIKNLWPAMLPSDGGDVRRLSEKTMDISQFLVDIMGLKLSVEKGASAIPVTYHDPCHLRKSLNIFEQPRRLIMANPAYRFLEMREADSCCGMGGSFSLKHYDLSTKIGAKKIASLHATGAAEVATACPACMIQLTDLLSKTDRPIPVRHVIELWAD